MPAVLVTLLCAGSAVVIWGWRSKTPAGPITPDQSHQQPVISTSEPSNPSSIVKKEPKSRPPSPVKPHPDPSSNSGGRGAPEPPSNTPKTTPADVRVRAFELAEADRCEEAVPLLECAASNEPRNSQVFYQLGRCQGNLHKDAEARENLTHAEELGEAPTKIASALGAIALASGDLGEAARQADRALAAQPAYLVALLLRGDLFMKQRKHSEAIQVCNSVFERTHSAESCLKLAGAYEKNGAPELSEAQKSAAEPPIRISGPVKRVAENSPADPPPAPRFRHSDHPARHSG